MNARSLAAQITSTAVAVGAATALFVAGAGVFVLDWQARRAQATLLRLQTQDHASRIEDRLQTIRALTRAAVGSSILRSALADNAGKELYAQPFMDRVSQSSGVPLSVYFVDFEGNTVLQSASAQGFEPYRSWVRGHLDHAREISTLTRALDRDHFVMLAPLVYERTRRTEGAIVVVAEVASLVPTAHFALAARAANERISEDTAVVALPDAEGGAELLVTASSEARHPLAVDRKIAMTLLLLGALPLSLLVAVPLSRRAARRTTADVDQLVADLQVAASRLDQTANLPRLNEAGGPEIRAVAHAVNDLLRSLDTTARALRRERELRLAGIIEGATDAIITIGTDQRIVQFNAAAEHMFRVTADQVLGSTVDRFVPPVFRGSHGGMINMYARSDTESRRRMGRARSFEALRADGEPFRAEATLTKSRIDGEEVLTVLIRDITDHVRAEEERHARELADAANKEKTAFLARMSHELRTPLNAVLGFSELMARESIPASPEVQRTRLTLITNSCRRLLALINDLLDVSRIELGALEVRLVGLDACTVVEAAAAELRSLAEVRDVQLMLELPADGVWVLADEMRLQQVVSNLLSNAIKYNRQGGEVRVRLVVRDEWASLAVTDSGIGMDEAQLRDLYQPFNRLGRHGSTEGTGIGLTITKNLVEAMGGRLEVSSTVGEGSCFVCLLQRSSPTAPETVPAAVAEMSSSVEAHGVLVYVEDEPVNQVLFSSMLALRPGVEVVIVGDGHSAIELVCQRPVDLLFVDMMLPDMDGVALAQHLREALGDRCPPMVAYSANALAADIDKALDAGFARYLIKPAGVVDLLGTVDTMMGAGRLLGADDPAAAARIGQGVG